MNGQEETVFVNFEKTEDKKSSGELEQAYLELGKAYYEGGFEDPLPQLLPLFDKITRLKKEAEKQKGLCPQCGGPVEEHAVFCGKCGYRLG